MPNHSVVKSLIFGFKNHWNYKISFVGFVNLRLGDISKLTNITEQLAGGDTLLRWEQESNEMIHTDTPRDHMRASFIHFTTFILWDGQVVNFNANFGTTKDGNNSNPLEPLFHCCSGSKHNHSSNSPIPISIFVEIDYIICYNSCRLSFMSEFWIRIAYSPSRS